MSPFQWPSSFGGSLRELHFLPEFGPSFFVKKLRWEWFIIHADLIIWRCYRLE